MTTRLCLLAGLTGALSATTFRAAADEPSPWSFDVTPYLWIASTDLETRLSTLPPSTPSEVDRLATKLRAGVMVTAEVRYESFGLLADFAWLRLNTEALRPGPAFSSVDVNSDIIHSTVALTYRLSLTERLHAEVLAGARVWSFEEELEAQGDALPGFTAAGEKSWVDPMVGANLSYDLSRRWVLATKGMVGGFGASAELGYDVFAGVSYRFSDRCSATLGYRYLHEEYDRDGFRMKTDMHGMLLGVGFHF